MNDFVNDIPRSFQELIKAEFEIEVPTTVDKKIDYRRQKFRRVYRHLMK